MLSDSSSEETPDKPFDEKNSRLLVKAIRQLNVLAVRKLLLHHKHAEPRGVSEAELLRFLKAVVQARESGLVGKILEYMPMIPANYGAELLWMVIEDDDTEIATMLVNAGADVNVRMPGEVAARLSRCEGCSFLHSLAESASSLKHQLGTMMMNRGANINAVNANGDSVLKYGLRFVRNSMEIAEEVLRRDARFDRQTIELAIDRVAYGANATVRVLLIIASQVAKLVAHGHRFDERDLAVSMELLRRKLGFSKEKRLRVFYNKCAKDLRVLQKIYITRGVSCFDILVANVTRLAFLMRNQAFVENYKRHLEEHSHYSYSAVLSWKFLRAAERKHYMDTRARLIRKVLKKFLPALVLDKILFNLFMLDEKFED